MKTKSTGGFAVRGVFARRLKASLPLSLEYVSNPNPTVAKSISNFRLIGFFNSYT